MVFFDLLTIIRGTSIPALILINPLSTPGAQLKSNTKVIEYPNHILLKVFLGTGLLRGLPIKMFKPFVGNVTFEGPLGKVTIIILLYVKPL